jgi:S-DNA-T family DNA segregation ATPase FtsK/SpoIIIE
VAVVSRAPAIDAETLRAATGREVELLRPPGPAALVPGRAPIIVGDVDAWSAGWGVLAAVRDRGDLVVHAGTAEYRAVVRDRTLPPLLDPGAPQCWLVVAGRAPSRRTWPNSGGPAG